MASDEPIERKIRADYARGAELFDGRAMGLVLSWLDVARKRAEEAERALAAVCEEAQTEAAEAGFQAMLAVTKRADAAERDAAYLRATVTEERAAREAAEKRAEVAERDAAWRAHERDSEAKRVGMHMKRAAAAEKRAEEAERALADAAQAVLNATLDRDAAEKRIGEIQSERDGAVRTIAAIIERDGGSTSIPLTCIERVDMRDAIMQEDDYRDGALVLRIRRALTPATGGE